MKALMAKLWPQKFRRVLPHIAVWPKLHPKRFFPGLVSKDIFQPYSLSLTLTFPMLEINLTTLTWSPPGCHLLHTSDPTPELYPSWNKRWPPPCRPSDLETLHRDIWAMEQLCQRKLTNHILRAMGQLAERQNKMNASLPFTGSLSQHHYSLLLKHICIS